MEHHENYENIIINDFGIKKIAIKKLNLIWIKEIRIITRVLSKDKINLIQKNDFIFRQF